MSAAAAAPADEAAGPMSQRAFLSPEECAAIRSELEFAFWYPSTVVQRIEERRVAGRISPCRVSETTDESWFTRELAVRMRSINARLGDILPGFEERREGWQATRYFRGGRFKPHVDCGHWDGDPAGEREHTLLIFLNSPRSGGETFFPYLGAAIRPVAGLLLTWRNLTADGLCDRRMTHSSLPLLAGRKTVLVTWLRQRAFQRRTP
jgi:prolyl 4-hydroxylase